MRFLRLQSNGEFSLVERAGNNIPRYAILSHTWGAEGEEITFQDIKDRTYQRKAGYNKILFCGKQAKQDGLSYIWVDTCCIDKSSSQELSEAINSMFHWYEIAERCYAYLADVSDCTSTGNSQCSRRWKPAFKKSRWFTRGWTLQELIAPASVEFFSCEGTCLGNKQSLEQTLNEMTGIPLEALRGSPLSQFSIDERFSWASKRITTREEDAAYCLLGIFDIQMPLLYAEGREKALKRLKKEIGEHTDNQAVSLNSEQKQTLLDSLQFDQIDARQMSIKKAHAKTCKWLLKKPEYLEWLDTARLTEHHGFLWIRGKPGAGKSTLMKFALSHARKAKGKIVISFFFNARGEDIEKSTIGTYRSLLFQLLERLPALQCVFDLVGLSSLSTNSNFQWSIETLKALLQQAIELLGETPVVCFIDALDECDEREIRDMIQFFEHIGELTVSTGITFQVCLSSRHYPHITIQKGLSLVLEGQEGHTQDIISYLESELKVGNSKIAQQIRSELQEKASGVFMWVVLVVGILNEEYDHGRIYALRRRLQEIPSDLHELFRDILTRDSRNREELVICIQWVLFAKQPLSPEQLYFAVLSGVEPDALSEYDSTVITENVIRNFILDSSKGLTDITKSKNQKVQFIHESVRDFLLKENGLGDIWPEFGNNLQGESHERLKHCCLTYINTDMFVPIQISNESPKEILHVDVALPDLATEMFPFLEYAVQNVLYHADMAEGFSVAQRSFIESFPRPRWIELDNLFERHEVRRHGENMTIQYVLGERNMSNLIRACPSPMCWLEVGEERYGTPFFAAMSTGSDEAVRAFIDAFCEVNGTGGRAQGIYAQYYKNKGKKNTFGRKFKFSKRRGIFSYLAEYGHEAVAEVLLEIGKVDVDSKCHSGRTPLSWAAEYGREVVVKMLLETCKVDIDSKCKLGQTPLWYAIRNGHEAVVKMLLETGRVDIESRSRDYGQTPLSWAAEKGRSAVVKMLLETGKVDVNSKCGWGRTPLLHAAQSGHEAVVKMLLETGRVDIESRSRDYGQTPLSWAAEYGREAVVKALIDTGKVDFDSKCTNFGRTPLAYAARNGQEAVVKMLLETGKVDINSKCASLGQTPLSRAAEYGCLAVVKVLLMTGKADIDSKCHIGRTPLSYAAGNGHKTVVKVLEDAIERHLASPTSPLISLNMRVGVAGASNHSI